VFLPLYGLLRGFCRRGKFLRCGAVDPGLVLCQPPGLGAKLSQLAAARVVFGNRTVEVPALARSRLPPFHGRGLRVPVDRDHRFRSKMIIEFGGT